MIFFLFSGAGVVKGIKGCFIALCRHLHSPGLLMKAHSGHPRNTHSSHFFLSQKGCLILLAVMALKRFLMSNVEPLNTGKRRQEGSRKLAARAQ